MHTQAGASEANLRWYLVQTKSGQELTAEQNLLRQNFRSFLPRAWKTVRHARKIQNLITSYFPGYLFVRLDLTRDRWRSINGTFGVVRLVSAGERPLAAPPGLVEDLQARADASGFIKGVQELAPGDAVRVTRGPFADHLATVDRLDGEDRVRVLLDLMAGPVPVVIARGAVSAV